MVYKKDSDKRQCIFCVCAIIHVCEKHIPCCCVYCVLKRKYKNKQAYFNLRCEDCSIPLRCIKNSSVAYGVLVGAGRHKTRLCSVCAQNEL